MSKLETVRALNDSAAQVQIAQNLVSLQQSLSVVQEQLERLPESIASETSSALEPLSRVRQEVSAALGSFETVVSLQRRTLDELTEQMSRSASAAFEQRSGELGATVGSLAASVNQMAQRAEQLQSLPGALVEATKSLQSAAWRLQEAAFSVRPPWWEQAAKLIAAGMVGALLAGTGQAALSRLLPPGALQEEAAWARAVWSRASAKERELLNAIVSRRAN
jgi:uncharacterized phage infection (PIP) family protein YhgE